MRPVLFRLGGIEFHSYPVLLYVGVVVGTYAGAAAAAALGLSAEHFAEAVVLLVASALLGARAWFVLVHWRVYRGRVNRIWRRREGGMAMYGGLLVATLLSVPLLGAFGLPFGEFWDAATVTMLVGMIPARVGCLLNGCCGGRPTNRRVAVTLVDRRGVRLPRYPTQLFELSWAVVLLAGACVVLDRHLLPGTAFAFAVAGYAAGRLFFEGLRDAPTGEPRLLVRRLVSAALLAVAGPLFALGWA